MKYEYEYPRPAVAVDLIVMRHSPDGQAILLIERKFEPFAKCWALPGGFLEESETLEAAAAREFQEETSLHAISLRQLRAYSAVDRDPRTRVVSVAFIAEVALSDAEAPGDDAAKTKWWPVLQLPQLAFDHQQIVADGLEFLASIKT